MDEPDRHVTVVTGAGSGIGAAIAAMLAARGDAVVVNDLRADAAETTAGRIRAAGGSAIACSGDVSEPAFATSLIATTLSTFGHVDALVNNAGILTRATVQELDPAVWDRVISVNLRSVFLCSQAAAHAMISRGGGAIVSITSVRAFAGAAMAPHYAAAKAGVVGFTRSFAGEVAQHGIRVNAVAPGLTDTDQPRSILTEAEMEIAAREIPLGRMAQPSDIASAVLFLCSPAASHITGTTLLVSGGSYVG
ncbi:MAG TPA: glucose 1-dehydrogenase [Candidatus Limnocylindrales bacterium]|nr:glucose 1-dehydrogenase [Candidatus Limnocylindrales bacterium]